MSLSRFKSDRTTGAESSSSSNAELLEQQGRRERMIRKRRTRINYLEQKIERFSTEIKGLEKEIENLESGGSLLPEETEFSLEEEV